MTQRKPITYAVNERGCHICTSHTPNRDGYPRLWKKGQMRHMHSVLYEEAHGKIKKGHLVRHTCDDRMCINLEHHVEGTPAQNTADMVQRGRHKYQFGETHTDAKLTTAQVEEIKQAPGNQAAIAVRYSITQSQVSRIKSGKRRRQG